MKFPYIFVLEGPDRVGKTTLAKNLQIEAAKYGLRIDYIHSNSIEKKLDLDVETIKPSLTEAYLNYIEELHARLKVYLTSRNYSYDYVLFDRSILSLSEYFIYRYRLNGTKKNKEAFNKLADKFETTFTQIYNSLFQYTSVYIVFILQNIPKNSKEAQEYLMRFYSDKPFLGKTYAEAYILADTHIYNISENLFEAVQNTGKYSIVFNKVMLNETDLILATKTLLIEIFKFLRMQDTNGFLRK